jgi:hypothetical protein
VAPLLFTENPRRFVTGTPYSPTRITLRYRSVGKRACSPGFLEEFFSETYGIEGSKHLHKLSPGEY